MGLLQSEDYSDLRGKLEAGLELIGGVDLTGVRNVVIKPNLCAARSPESGATVDVGLVREIIRILNDQKAGLRIRVVEAEARGVNVAEHWDIFDYHSLEEEFDNVELVNLTHDASYRVTLDDGHAFHLLEVPETLMDADFLVNVAKLKTHADERMTAALKNQYGLVTKKYKYIFHPFLKEVIHDVNQLHRADLCIVDGVIGMEGFGPTDGTPKRAGVMLFGHDPVATDVACARVMGWRPSQVPYLKYAIRHEGFPVDAVELRGAPLEDVQTDFEFLPTRHWLIARAGLRLRRYTTWGEQGGGFLMKVRSAMSLVGTGEVAHRVSLRDMLRIAHRMVFRFNY